MRVYIASTIGRLRDALAAGVIDVRLGYAVTPALREWYVEGDQEELEYAAATVAARASLRLLADAGEQPRRVVLAVDLPDRDLRPAPAEDRAAVRVGDPVPVSLIASALVDDPAAADDVRRGASAVAAADAGDDDAIFLVDSVEDHELAWFASSELAALVEE